METYYSFETNALVVGGESIPLSVLRGFAAKSAGFHDVMRLLSLHMNADFTEKTFRAIHEALEMAVDLGALRIQNMVRTSDLGGESWQDGDSW